MAKKTDVFGVSGTDTVIGSSVKLKGNLTSDGDITIDGRMIGNIKSGGHITIGINAQINGDISGTSVAIGGKLQGNITSLDTVSITESGQVNGDIQSSRLEIAMGGLFIGSSKMKPIEATEVADREQVDGAVSS